MHMHARMHMPVHVYVHMHVAEQKRWKVFQCLALDGENVGRCVLRMHMLRAVINIKKSTLMIDT